MPQSLRRPLVTSIVSLILATAVIGAWLALHIFAVWQFDGAGHQLLAALCLVGLSWLSVGLFIVARDAVMRYAAFFWRKLIVMHMARNRQACTDGNPDLTDGGSMQMFVFGRWLPISPRHDALTALFTRLHFGGYHHGHHQRSLVRLSKPRKDKA